MALDTPFYNFMVRFVDTLFQNRMALDAVSTASERERDEK